MIALFHDISAEDDPPQRPTYPEPGPYPRHDPAVPYTPSPPTIPFTPSPDIPKTDPVPEPYRPAAGKDNSCVHYQTWRISERVRVSLVIAENGL